MIQRVRLPVVGGLVKVLSNPTTTNTIAAITELQAAVNALNAAVAVLQNPTAKPGTFSSAPTGTVKVTETIGSSPAFMASDSAPAADPSILVHRGRKGDDGEPGARGYPAASAAPGLRGLQGFTGRRGEDGEDGRRVYILL